MMTSVMAVTKAAVMEIAYRGSGEKTGMDSSDVKANVEALTPPKMPVIRPPTRQPTSMRG